MHTYELMFQNDLMKHYKLMQLTILAMDGTPPNYSQIKGKTCLHIFLLREDVSLEISTVKMLKKLNYESTN